MASSPSPDEAERLVLADELLGRGDLRGELIVVQCELARGGHSRERGITMRRRELELLLAHENEWAKLDGLARNWMFRRGFVDEITVDITKFADNEEEIWKRAPFLRWLRFTGLQYDSPIDDLGDAAHEWDKVRPRLERALASGRVRYFVPTDAIVTWMNDSTNIRYRESGSLSSVIARWLATETSILARLRGIALWNIREGDFSLLASRPEAAGIEELELVGSFDRAVAPTSYVRPRRARLLHSRETRDDFTAVRDLLASPFAENLTDLECAHVLPVLDSGCASRLRSLHVSSTFDLEPLLEGKGLDSLRTLRLGSGVRIAVARRLLRSPLAQRLEEIDLRDSELKPHVHELRTLWDGFLLL